jgi:hypothetical protein
MTEEEINLRRVSVTDSEFSFMPPVRVTIEEPTPNGTRGDVFHLQMVEALALYQELGEFLRAREEI